MYIVVAYLELRSSPGLERYGIGLERRGRKRGTSFESFHDDEPRKSKNVGTAKNRTWVTRR
jgi:hypothetical protein